jgi:hypothetical protein
VSQKITHISFLSGFLKAKTSVLLKYPHIYSGYILANSILQSTANEILNPKASQLSELTTPDYPGTLNDLRCYP